MMKFWKSAGTVDNTIISQSICIRSTARNQVFLVCFFSLISYFIISLQRKENLGVQYDHLNQAQVPIVLIIEPLWTRNWMMSKVGMSNKLDITSLQKPYNWYLPNLSMIMYHNVFIIFQMSFNSKKKLNYV